MFFYYVQFLKTIGMFCNSVEEIYQCSPILQYFIDDTSAL